MPLRSCPTADLPVLFPYYSRAIPVQYSRLNRIIIYEMIPTILPNGIIEFVYFAI